MTRPRSNQFGSYFKALHGYEPFPWQRRLAASILEAETWPHLLDIPTGLGKTSAIDVALFVLAVRPEIAPRRIILVVDRRVVVDQAAEHARRIQGALTRATDGVLFAVAGALRALWGGAPEDLPFEVAVLRGGMPRDEAWAHRPDRPVVATSTVDQVGSRLLFRGYGVSPTMAPIHAGLLGHDTLILLDEVQLSAAFAETLRVVAERWRLWREWDHAPGEREGQIPERWAFVRMSATPVGEAAKDEVRFGLDADDQAHSIVEQRLGASKLATLAEPIAVYKNDAGKTLRAMADGFAKGAVEYLDSGARRIAVIVNRVATARQIHEELKQRTGERADVVLLTGRMRPLDREAVFGVVGDPASVAARVTAGSRRATDQRPVIVVSTQTIEAGADFDFDALVTECASIDALRQRFGRLDRRGELRQTRATILIRKDQATDSQDDPVYGAALSKTWSWLSTKGGAARQVDFGIARFPPLPKKNSERAELCSPVQHAPVLLPAHLDAWAQTQPRGAPDPEVSCWLHGPRRGIPEVRVVWRADIDAEALTNETHDARVEAYAAASLAVAPPSSLESISVPLPACRAWLAQESGGEIADVEGVDDDLARVANGREEGRRRGRAFLIVGRSGVKVQRRLDGLYPEATIVVPASYGGIRDGNWNPDASEHSVRDLGDLAQLLHRGRPVLRLVPSVLCPLLVDPAHADVAGEGGSESAEPDNGRAELSGLELPAAAARTVPMAPATDDPDLEQRGAVRAWLEATRDLGSEMWRLVVDAVLAPRARLRLIELGSSGFFAVVGQRLPGRKLAALRQHIDLTSDIVNDDDDSASYLGRHVSLEQHLGDVERWARRFAENVALPASLTDDLALAARLHDIGKADPRFQQMLHGGSLVRMAASNTLLAKSRGESGDQAARRQARERSKYPDGYRHELLSVAMLEANAQALSRASDPALVLHLVGSHHGWCRPFAPAVDHGPSVHVAFSLNDERFSADTAHGLAAVDSGVADRYWLLTERYGWWTLAWLEALVRLADHRASEESARGDAGRTQPQASRISEQGS